MDEFDYDMAAILKSDNGSSELIDLPDFTHKGISIQKFPGKGRGVIATQEMCPGQLLIAEKAIVIVFPNELLSMATPGTTRLKIESKKLSLLREKLLHCLQNDVELIPKVYNLHAGPHLKHLELGHDEALFHLKLLNSRHDDLKKLENEKNTYLEKEKFETEEINGTTENATPVEVTNSKFPESVPNPVPIPKKSYPKYPPPLPAYEDVLKPKKSSVKKVIPAIPVSIPEKKPNFSDELERIEHICALNGFQGHESSPSGSSYGLWDLPSYLNHSCAETNAHWRIFKNMIFIRASEHFRKGQEILISYLDANRPYSERLQFFLKHDFFCHCKLCELEKKEGKEVRREREVLLSDFENRASGIACFRIVESLRTLRPGAENAGLNVFLISPLLELGLCFYEKTEYETATQVFEECFDLCRVSAQFSLLRISCALTIATCYLRRVTGKGLDKVPLMCLFQSIRRWIDVSKSCVQLHFGKFTSFKKILEIIRPTFVSEMTKFAYDLS